MLKGLFSKKTITIRRKAKVEEPIQVVPPTCPNCTKRPAAAKPSPGEFFDYCSKACATQARKGGSTLLCQQCNQRARFNDGTTVHPYCGRTCAKLAASGSPTPNQTSPPVIPPTLGDSLSVLSGMSSAGLICKDSDCTLPAFVDPNGIQSNYCMLHKEVGEEGCISCRIAPSTSKSVLCQICYDDALSRAPALVQVPDDHRNYKSVEKQFKDTWRHKTTCPEVKAVYKIVVTDASMAQYQKYLDGVESKGNFVAMGKSRGNENRRWHGTRRKCNLGDIGHHTFCADMECALCCIIQLSFDLKFFKAATGWGRFGRGIYTSSTSSKSNDYSKNLGTSSEWKALLLNKVVVGNGRKLTQDDTSLTEPPPGYDSVLAEVVPGGALNYDELVVYQNEAVRPSYLVMYKSP